MATMVVLLGLLSAAILVSPRQPDNQIAAAAVHAGRECTVVRQYIGTKKRDVCLLMNKTGRSDHGWTLLIRVPYTHMAVDWRYRCPKGMPRPSFVIAWSEDLGQDRVGAQRYLNHVVALVTNRISGHGRVRNYVGDSPTHRFSFDWRAGSLDARTGAVGLTRSRHPCTWRVTVTGDNDTSPAPA